MAVSFIVCGLNNREPLALVLPPCMAWQNLPPEGILAAHGEHYIAAAFPSATAAEAAIARTCKYFKTYHPESEIFGGWLVFQLQPVKP